MPKPPLQKLDTRAVSAEGRNAVSQDKENPPGEREQGELVHSPKKGESVAPSSAVVQSKLTKSIWSGVKKLLSSHFLQTWRAAWTHGEKLSSWSRNSYSRFRELPSSIQIVLLPILVPTLLIAAILFTVLLPATAGSTFLAAAIHYLLIADPFAKPVPPRSVHTSHRSAEYDNAVPFRNSAHPALIDSANGCETISELFAKSVRDHGRRHALGYREKIRDQEKEIQSSQPDGTVTFKRVKHPFCSDYLFRTYAEVYEEALAFGRGLAKMGVAARDRFSIYANTSYEWQVAAQACFSHNITVVTLYSNLGEDALKFGLNQTRAAGVLTDVDMLERIVAMKNELTELKFVVYKGMISREKERRISDSAGSLQLYSWKAVVGQGKAGTTAGEQALRSPTPEDVALIMYTSGSTGQPKGVVMTHRNIVSTVGAMLLMIPDLGENDVYVSFLPLAHVLELVAEITLLAAGASIGYSSPQSLRDDQVTDAYSGKPKGDLSALKPTLLAGVPVVMDRMRAGVEGKVASAPFYLRWLFRFAYHFKRRAVIQGRCTALWDRLVFQHIAQRAGGKLRMMLSGGAPLSPETQEFMQICFCAPVLQGYGLTETCGAAAITHPNDFAQSNVGAPVPCCELKLADCPEMGYTNDYVDEYGTPTPRGEICVRGFNVTSGYFQNDKLTEESYKHSEAGKGPWFYTGDLAERLPNGTVRIIDRKKDLVKTAGGEYVAISHLESIYRQSIYVEQICVHADPSKDRPIGIVVPNRHNIETTAKAMNDAHAGNFEKLCENKSVTRMVLQSCIEEAKKANLKNFETIAAIQLVPDEWTVESGLVNAAGKMVRKAVYDKYAENIKGLYDRRQGSHVQSSTPKGLTVYPKTTPRGARQSFGFKSGWGDAVGGQQS